MNKLTLPLLACLVALSIGCATQNRPLTVAIVKSTVMTGALFGIEQDPTIVPYLRAATPVICNAAGKGMLDPAAVVAALQSSDVEQFKTPLGIAIINSSLAIYEAVYASYGENVANSDVQPYLEGICYGLTAALPPAGATFTLTRGLSLPPHVR